jgi:2-keto-3-deoxy-L-arabinonate dehydratase
MSEWQGVFPILLTTFDESGRLDTKSQLALVDYLINAGAHGIALFGNASEGYTLSNEERLTLMKLIIPHVRKRIPVIVSTGHTGTDCAVALSKQAEEMKADGLMILPPYYMKTDGNGLMHYYGEISSAVSIPIMVQDAPLMTQVAMSGALLARMGKEIKNVRYVKVEAAPTPRKVSEVHASAQRDLTIFGGLNGNFLLEELARGSEGTMPGSDMIPELVSVWNLYRTHKSAEAREQFAKLLPMIRFELQPGLGVSAMKHNLKAAGVIVSARVRHPTGSLDAADLTELEALRHRQ